MIDAVDLDTAMLSAANAVGWQFGGLAERPGGYTCQFSRTFTGDEDDVSTAFELAIEGLMDVAVGAGAWRIDVLTRELHDAQPAGTWDGTVTFGLVPRR